MVDADSTWDKAAGKVKETAGEVTGDKDLEAEGTLQNAQGKVEEVAHNAAEKVGDAVDDVKAGAKALGDKISGAFKKDDD